MSACLHLEWTAAAMPTMTTGSVAATASEGRRPGLAVGILVLRAGHVLLGRRLPPAHGHGTYAAQGGRVRFGESVDAAIRRELREETGLIVRQYDVLGLTGVRAYGQHWVALQVVVTDAEGDPQLLEPEVVAGWDWYLPSQPPRPLFPACQMALDMLADNHRHRLAISELL